MHSLNKTVLNQEKTLLKPPPLLIQGGSYRKKYKLKVWLH